MYTDHDSVADRVRAAVPVAVVHALLALTLLYGLGGPPPEKDKPPLRLVTVEPPPPLPDQPPPPPPLVLAAGEKHLPPADPEPEGAASPPNLKAEPSPIVAPESPLPTPQPVQAAPIAGSGVAPSAGAAPIRGPSTGAGGIGIDRGSGNGRSGTGGGGGGAGGSGPGRIFAMPRHIRGDFSVNDIPAPLQDAGFRGRVRLRFLIDVDGRAKNCQAIRSSGNRQMDANACSAVEQRFRFVPARDVDGRPIAIPGEDEPYFEAAGDDRRGRRDRDDDDW